ncbi:HD domain-containing protein [Thermoactinomyces sp. DSM 45892]|uniref:HD domain-containing protein n=1 Tax=Thermoactinomyces sp. DSM 45892 TaxID=1882753 RepID=UPI0008976E3D|nr:HD domain-containing protein [Thermoactinomyces sp. DSM 45892]SDZ36188.1 metal dependent phosphohydrolase [Thermoactinomyces sp. DSM 45892]
MISLLVDSQDAIKTSFDPQELSYYLPPTQDRYHHILGVVDRMKELVKKIVIPDEWRTQLIQTAFLHDIGYSEQLNQYNFHPLDGALFVQKIGISKSVLAAILFHSDAYTSAKHIRPDLFEVYSDNYDLLDETDHMFIDLITYCDIHTSPTGIEITLQERVRDVVRRYGEGHPVSDMMLLSQTYYQEVEQRVEKMFNR